jgi:hypothetical protein
VKTRHRTFTPEHKRVLNLLEYVNRPMSFDDIVLSVYTPEEVTLAVLEDLVGAGLARRTGNNSYVVCNRKKE